MYSKTQRALLPSLVAHAFVSGTESVYVWKIEQM